MRVSRQAQIAGVSSAVALIILVVGFFVLIGGKTAIKPTANRHLRQHRAWIPLTSPFTGERIRSLGPELIFKIDNVIQARPPTGLNKADIVYLLPVDAGLSRIFAVFSSHIPPVVGPVRSSRSEDITLLRQFGRPAFAYSGAQPELLPVVERSRIINLYAGLVAGYFRDYRRVEPYNLYARTRQLLREAKGASRARDIGFRFGPPPRGGKPTKVWSVTYPEASFTFRWSPHRHRWLCWMDGRPAYGSRGGQLGGGTVVIQSVVVSRSRYRELGIKPPYAATVGSGSAVVLRNGRAYRVRWSRRKPDGGTTFTLPGGHRMLFARGQVWVVFRYGPGSNR